MMKLSIVITALDRASAPLRRVSAAATALGKSGFGSIRSNAPAASSRLDQLSARTRSLGAAMGRAAIGMRNLAGRAGMATLRAGAYATGYALGSLIKLALRATAVTGAAITGGVGYLLGGVVSVGMQFEKFQAQLEGTEGSAAKAKRALAWVRDFAKKTPYDVAEVTAAFTQARQYGIDPFTGAFTSMGNAASAVNKTLLEAVEAVSDAQQGENERLKAFGINASVKGGQVTFSYLDKAGKNASRTVKKNISDIQHAVLDIFNVKYAGGMERQAKTLGGMLSNIRDMIIGFQLDVANAGFFEHIKGQVARLLGFLNKLSADGTLQRWAQSISKWMSQAFDQAVRFTTQVDWQNVVRGIGGIISMVISLVGWIGKAISYMSRWGLESERRVLQKKSEGWWVSDADKAAYGRRIAEIDQQLAPPGLAGARRRKPAPADPWARGRAGIPSLLRAPAASGGPFRFAPAMAAGRAAPTIVAPTAKSQLTIRLEGDQARNATVQSMRAAPGTTINLMRGPVRAGTGL